MDSFQVNGAAGSSHSKHLFRSRQNQTGRDPLHAPTVRKDEEAVSPIVIENGARIVPPSSRHSPDTHGFAKTRQRRRAQESLVVDFNQMIDERKLPEQWNDSPSTHPMNFAAGSFLEHLDRRKSHHDVPNGAELYDEVTGMSPLSPAGVGLLDSADWMKQFRVKKPLRMPPHGLPPPPSG
jgi:hypothetical protein